MSIQTKIDVDILHRWVTGVLCSVGYAQQDAGVIAASLTDADMRGIHSHGVMRLPIYVQRVRAGLVHPRAEMTIESAGTKSSILRSVVRMNANAGSGQVAAMRAITHALDERSMPHAAVFIKNSSHFGTAGYFAREIARRNYAALVMSNAEACVIAHGGTKPVLGTNPISCAVPFKLFPLCFDISTSVVSFGKIFEHRAGDAMIPGNWGVDNKGMRTTNPHEVAAVRPLGSMEEGYKGFALGLFVDVLCGVLSGSAFGADIGNMYNDFSRAQDVGHFLWMISIPELMDMQVYRRRVNLFVEMMRSSGDGVVLPGERAHWLYTEAREHGVAISCGVRDELDVLAREVGVTPLV